MDFLVYGGITADRTHPTKRPTFSIEEAVYCREDQLDATLQDLMSRHVTTGAVRLSDPKALAALVHAGLC
ncbi:hypothetical protein DYI24_00935 [Rhodopseudomonas sp. BR0C11]|uniref:hypothetical protein n=1 Tax=Rhodopseudomonas sp. BR0C11 TaxID=2269370 RepID=UPI0013E02BE9|nr:hypothetical protein [Rhodopseudomonas sp. BR0C11]NEV75630.1 hypothetical protein [Rhodopseudomonas sp. BR0C11]